MVIAGLDISTSVAGYCTMDEDGTILESDYYRFKKDKGYDLIDLVEQFEEHVLPKIVEADVVVLEAALKKYAGGFSTNRSITVLLQFNALVEYVLMRDMGKDKVTSVHPATARKGAIGRGTSPKGVDTKDWILKEVGDLYDIEWPLTRYGNVRAQCEDEADAIVLARYHVEENI
jgi:hypothetical protein